MTRETNTTIEAMAKQAFEIVHSEIRYKWEDASELSKSAWLDDVSAIAQALSDNITPEMMVAGMAALDEKNDPETPIYCDSDKVFAIIQAALSAAIGKTGQNE